MTRTSVMMMILVFLFASLIVTEGLAPFSPSSAPTGRDPLLWPFADYSVWNLPIGDDAVYVAANIVTPNSYTFEHDPDVLILKPDAPMTPVYYNSAGWDSSKSRCPAQGNVLWTAPFPRDFVITSTTNNYAAAQLMPDNRTIIQGQPLTHCTSGGNATALVKWSDADLYSAGTYGAHGGSGLSSLGGTLRLGEMMPNGISTVRHALKTNLFGHLNYYRVGNNKTTCYRWPAFTCDSGFADNTPYNYGGTNPVLRVGALLALPRSMDINNMGLTTEPGLMMAWTFQNYGAYIVDDAGWNVFAIATELSPDGDYAKQFKDAWGFGFGGPSNPFSTDMATIYAALHVVDNWSSTLYTNVKASNGTLGAGGGTARQSWAPPFGNNNVNPVTGAGSASGGSSSSSASRLSFWWQ